MCINIHRKLFRTETFKRYYAINSSKSCFMIKSVEHDMKYSKPLLINYCLRGKPLS